MYCVSFIILYCDQQMHTIILQIITLLHVSTLSCHPQGACNQYFCQFKQVFRMQLLVIEHISCKLYYQQLHLKYLSRIWGRLKDLHIYIVSRHSSREHRALTKFRHLTRLLASTLTSFHVLPWCLISSKIVLRHVVRGLPWDLVP